MDVPPSVSATRQDVVPQESEPIAVPAGVGTVIFDLFGTLVDNVSRDDWLEFLKQASGILQIPARTFAIHWSGHLRDKRTTGEIPTVEAGIAWICEELGMEVDGMAVLEATHLRWEFTRRSMVPRPDSVSTISALLERGYKVGLISDCTDEVVRIWPSTPFAPLIQSPVFSCASGAKKPDPVLYEKACEGLVSEPETCVYVGDGSSEELTGAAAFGMYPLLICTDHEESIVMPRSDGKAFKHRRLRTLSELLTHLPEQAEA